MPEHHVGKHSLRIEGDVVHVKYVASVSLEELQQLTAFAAPFLDSLSSPYLVYDVSEAGLMTPQARKFSAEQSKNLRCAAAVIYGTTLFTRAAIALVLSAVRLTSNNLPQIVYVKDEQEARGWIAAHRRSQPTGAA